MLMTGLALGNYEDGDYLTWLAAEVGADGPMCLHARAAWAEGFMVRRAQLLWPQALQAKEGLQLLEQEQRLGLR